MYVPGVEEKAVRVDDADPPDERVTLVGLTVDVKPEGETVDESDTVPEKVFKLARLMVAVAEEPDWSVRLEELLEILKSAVLTTLTVTVVEWDNDPLVPVTVTV